MTDVSKMPDERLCFGTIERYRDQARELAHYLKEWMHFQDYEIDATLVDVLAFLRQLAAFEPATGETK